MLDDDGHLLCKSGAIVEYLLSRYSHGRLAHDAAGPNHMRFLECLYFAVSAGMNPVMFKVYARAFDLVGEPIGHAATRELEAALDYIETLLGSREWLVGDRFTAADIQTSFIPELAQAVGAFTGHATIVAWQKRLYARPAFHRAIERGGKTYFARPE